MILKVVDCLSNRLVVPFRELAAKMTELSKRTGKILVLAVLCCNYFAVTHLFTVRIDSRPGKTAFKHRYQHTN